MAYLIKVLAEPCADGAHEFNEYLRESWVWPGKVHYRWERHCVECGWYVMDCATGCCHMERKISSCQRDAIAERKAHREELRGQAG